ncbi:MAG: TRAP transporter small permease [Gammaproteobacteria bacterium]|nr:TRAP transporter small permease [Gammaproteobacteria bacterium]
MHSEPTSKFGRLVDQVEQSFIAILLGVMTLITFANVIARYVFNANILWALETTVFLFAWLVLVGASYCVKIGAHLGVDVMVAHFSARWRRYFGLLAVTACLAFSVVLVIGAWEYWLPFVSKRAWYEVDDIRMPDFLQFLAPWLNEGERWEKLPRFIPYFALPLGMVLLTYRFLQAGWRIWTGTQDMVIASHEVEELLEEASAEVKGG